MWLQIFYQKRYLVAFLAFFGYVNMYCLSTNLSMALVEMTSNKTSLLPNGTYVYTVEFDWDFDKKGLALNAYSFGQLFMIFGGIAATRYGGATIFGIGIGAAAIITFFTPLLIRLSFLWFLAGRALQGVWEGFFFASASELWSKWSPPNERSKLVSFSFTGLYVGLAICYPICGFLATVSGWPAIFYVTSISGIIWSIIWLLIVKNDPLQDKQLSIAERELFTKQTDQSKRKAKRSYPWKGILTSLPVWSISAVGFIFCIGFSFTVLYLPLYIKDINNIDISSIGIFSGIPHLCTIISHPIAGYLADLLREKKIFSATQIHKLYISIGCFMGAGLLYGITFCSNFYCIILLLGLFRAVTSFSEVTFHVNVIDLSNNYASLLLAITTTFFIVGSIITPVFIGNVVRTHSQSEWNLCFIALGILNVLAGLFYIFFSSGERQPWDVLPDEQDQNEPKNSETRETA